MANSRLKYTYFDVRGLGEVSRMILAYGQKEYEDNRIAHAAWPELKPTMPLDQMPILEIDGQVFPQSIAIQNFLAREFDLYPTNTMDQLTVDVVSQVVSDIMKAQATWYYMDDCDKKWELQTQSRVTTAKYLKFYEDMLRKSGTGFFVGNTLTLADLIVLDITTGFLRHSLDFTPEKYPLIAHTVKNVLKDERVGKYVATRPDSFW